MPIGMAVGAPHNSPSNTSPQHKKKAHKQDLQAGVTAVD